MGATLWGHAGTTSCAFLLSKKRPPNVGEGLQPSRLGEVDAKTVAAALILAGHLRRSVAELLLHIALVAFGRGGKACAERMAGEKIAPFACGHISTQPGCERCTLDETGNRLVVEPVRADLLA